MSVSYALLYDAQHIATMLLRTCFHTCQPGAVGLACDFGIMVTPKKPNYLSFLTVFSWVRLFYIPLVVELITHQVQIRSFFHEKGTEWFC